MPAAIAIAAALLLVLPAAASAADTYADSTAPDNSGDCLTPATACQTIDGIDGALSKSGSGDTTFVADGTYAESIVLGDGKSLVSLDGTDPKPIIDNGVDLAAALTIDASGAGTVSDLTIRSDYKSLDVFGTVTVQQNVFDEDTLPSNSGSNVTLSDGASIVIDNNTFVDPDATGVQYGIETLTGDTPAPVISGNTFTDLAAGILVQQLTGGVQISDNTFAGAHPIGTTPVGDFPGAGVLILGAGNPTITENTFEPANSGPSAGVYVQELTGFDAGATLRRNRISGYDVGVQAIDTTLPVTLDNDLIYDNESGLLASDSSSDVPPSTQGDVSATNATIFNNDTDVGLSFTTLTVDSSIVDDPIDLAGGNGACAITYSRGSSTLVPNGCDDFDTTATPQFVDPLTGDYHLQSASALIDVGNPADPGPGAVDFYGDPRMVLGKACNAVRRDIGADEFNPASQPECAQDTYADVSRPNDLGDCVTPATACKTIAAALARSADDQTSLVADGTYAESLILDGGRSLVSLDAADPRPVIDSGVAANGPGIRVEGEAGTVSGFRVRSDDLPMLIQDATVEVEDNVFDEDTEQTNNVDLTISGGSGIAVHDNVFVDPDASGMQFGLSVVENPTSAVISDNTFTDLSIGIAVSEEGAQITGNQFSGARPPGPALPGFPGAGVLVINGHPAIAGNTFGAPVSHPSAGVHVSLCGCPSFSAGATLSRNRISGNDVGVQVVDTDSPVTLSNDLIYDNTTGIEATDSSADSPTPSTQGDVSVTNATIFGNAVDASISFTTLTLNSTIVGTPIDMVGNGACSISYSRGSSAANANGCGSFATSADPQFVDAAGGDFHLQSTSALIDAGDPAAPGGGVVDFYGGPRAVQGKACSTARRDVGAAEYEPATTPECPPSPVEPPVTPAANRPVARIDKRPGRQTTDRSPTFDFSSDMAGASFRCRLDNKAWKACTPPVTYYGLRFGKHRFRVYATGPTGMRGRTRLFKFAVVRDK